MNRDTWVGNVLVVGAGPAGETLARRVAQAGFTVLLADENPQPGGQITRRRFAADPRPCEAAHAGRYRLASNLDFQPGAVCHGSIGDDGVLLSLRDSTLVARVVVVVVATGAIEKVLPVPGWTLPGVMTAGAAQTLLKGSGVFPYRSAVVAGSGPLLLAAASQLVESGVTVRAVIEAIRPAAVRPHIAVRALAAPEILAEGMRYLRVLRRAHVPITWATGIAAAEGDGRVQRVSTARLDATWALAGESRGEIECDALVLSHGFTSCYELAAQMGSQIDWDAQRQTYRPCRDRDFRTTVPTLFAIGDCAGVGGAAVARVEAQIAAEAVISQLGGDGDERAVRGLRRRLRRLEIFRRAMDRMYLPGPGAAQWPDENTCACRCQDVAFGELRQALDNDVLDYHGAKLWTRIGMGPCQGRSCSPILTQQLAARGVDPQTLQAPHVRFPVRPLSGGAAAQLATRSPLEGDR